MSCLLGSLEITAKTARNPPDAISNTTQNKHQNNLFVLPSKQDPLPTSLNLMSDELTMDEFNVRVWRLGGVGCSHLLGVCYYCFQFSSKWGIL
jgi:hypothetical protein